jgi:serine/threonine protein kinase
MLGHGGFGITYIGWDTVLSRKTAIKEFFPSGVALRTGTTSEVFPCSAAMRQEFDYGINGFLEEARLVASFDNHPNIIWVKDFFPENGTAYMVTEYLDGETFEKFLDRRGGRVAWDLALRIMTPVMDALREVHRAGILHRDISPDNIFLVQTGMVKLIDFGAARRSLGQRSQNFSVILKHGYGPQEQYESKGRQGPWTDVYAAAATLYRALTGQAPPSAPDRLGGEPLVPPSAAGAIIPQNREKILLKALALRFEERYQDMAAFENDLISSDTTQSIPPDPILDPPWYRVYAKWIYAGAAAILALVILFSLLQPGPAPVVRYFQVEPSSIESGKSATLSWAVENVSEVQIDGLGKQPASGRLTVAPRSSETFTLIARGKDGEDTRRSLVLQVEQPRRVDGPVPRPIPNPTDIIPRQTLPRSESAAPVEILSFELNPATVRPGETSTLTWSVRGATTVQVEGVNGLTNVQSQGSVPVRFVRSTTLRLVARGPGGVATSSAGVTVAQAAAPVPTPATDPRVVMFAVNPESVSSGQEVTLAWNTQGAAQVRISGFPRFFPPAGEVRITPRSTTRFQLIAVGVNGGRAMAEAYVQVAPATIPVNPMNRQVAASRWVVIHDHEGAMSSLLQNRGGGAWNRCDGVLSLASDRLSFQSHGSNDGFDVSLSDVQEVKTNRIAIRGNRAFHVKLRSGENYNFISRDHPDRVVANIQRSLR